jgi:glycosyltransferase involved in cell wall biosynthesis
LGWGLGTPQGSGLWGALREPGRRRFLSQFDGLIAYSQRGADEYRRMGFPAERVFVAPNAVAPRPAQPPAERPPAFAGRPVVLFVGRLQRRKRIDNLLHACAALPPELQPELWIVGDGPAMAEFQALAQQVYPQAHFPGAKRGEELQAYFSAADLFVLPGTGGLAVQEAMAHGLPVIVAEGDGTQDDLVRPGNGWRIPADDLGALNEALQNALVDAGRLRLMGAESYRIVAEEANLERMVQVFIEALVTVRS